MIGRQRVELACPTPQKATAGCPNPSSPREKDHSDLARVKTDLMAMSRKARFAKLRSKANSWLISVIGRKAILGN